MAGVSFLVAAGAKTGGIVLWRKCKNDIFIGYQILIPGRREEGAKRELFYRVGADKVQMALQGDARRVRCGCDVRGCVTRAIGGRREKIIPGFGTSIMVRRSSGGAKTRF